MYLLAYPWRIYGSIWFHKVWGGHICKGAIMDFHSIPVSVGLETKDQFLVTICKQNATITNVLPEYIKNLLKCLLQTLKKFIHNIF